jgi:hypothetical protein
MSYRQTCDTSSSAEDIDALDGLGDSEPLVTSSAGPGNPLTIIQGGALVSQSSLIEVKSASQKSATRQKWSEIYPQLYLSQTPWLYTAIHNDGKFYTVEKTQLGSPELADIAEQSKHRFKKLRLALQTIKDLVVESGIRGRLSFVLENRELKVYERSSRASCLPDDIMSSFQ